MSTPIEQKKKDRFLILEHLYDKTEGDVFKYLGWNEIIQDLITEHPDFDAKYIQNQFIYLSNEHLAERKSLGTVGITHYGIKEIEEARSNPNKETNYFPPINVIQIEHMESSLIQQGTTDSAQIGIFTIRHEDMEKFISELNEAITDLGITGDNLLEIESDIKTIEAQLTSSRAKPSIVKESLLSIKTILEGVASNVIAKGLLASLASLL